MMLSEAKEIRAFIVRHCPFSHKARRISRDAIRTINNQREDVAWLLHCSIYDLAKDYEIEPREALELERAHKLALDYIETSKKEVVACH